MIALPIDYNNDGFIDLVTDEKIFRNNNDLTFIEDSTTGINLPLGSLLSTQITTLDYNNDYLPDILISNPIKLYRNNGDDTFSDVTSLLSISIVSGTGIAVGDYNNDGFIDIFLTSPNVLYKNNGDDTFSDVTQVSGIGNKAGIWWGTEFFDFDNDGYIDIYIAPKGEGFVEN